MNLTDNVINTGNYNKVLHRSLAFLGGVTIGSVAALLFAPKKGSESRKQIVDKFNSAAFRIGGRANEKEPKITMAASPVETMNRHTKPSNASRTVKNNDIAHASKAQSMIGHLKHTKKDSAADYVD